MSFRASFPLPKLFTQSTVLSQSTRHLAEDNQVCRQLHQVCQQAEFGQKLLSAVSKQLMQGNFEILKVIPVPKTISTEDGWEFELEADNYYRSADGLAWHITAILELMLQTPESREDSMFPQVEVLKWTFFEVKS